MQRISYIASGLDDACHPEERSDDEVLRSQIILNDPAKEEGSNACRQSTNGDGCEIGGGNGPGLLFNKNYTAMANCLEASCNFSIIPADTTPEALPIDSIICFTRSESIISILSGKVAS